MKIKGDSYYLLRRNNCFRMAVFFLVLIYCVYFITASVCTLKGTSSEIMFVEEEDNFRIVLKNDPFRETDRPVTVIKKENTPEVFPLMPVVAYENDGHTAIITFPFYSGVLCFTFSVLFAVTGIVMIVKLKKERVLRENIRRYGRRYSASYHSTEKMKGIKKYRITVVASDPISKKDTFYHTPTLIFNPSIFIGDIKDIDVFTDMEDESLYVIDFKGAIPSNEDVYMH